MADMTTINEHTGPSGGGPRILHVVSVSGGKDSLATLLIALARFGRHRVIPMFCDTGNEHQAVYDYLDYLETRLSITIVRLRARFDDEIAAKRAFIARDQRTSREVLRLPVFDVNGMPVYARHPGDGAIITKQQRQRDGSMVTVPVQKTRKVAGRRVRWTNRAKRRALAVLYPTGNPFLDLCLWKGRFPSRMAQFCTQELKRNPAVEFQLSLVDKGHTVVSWQGVRRDESLNRRNAAMFEPLGGRLFIYRPIVDWTAARVFAYSAAAGVRPNPLYLQGMNRVGCMPCINVAKDELREIAARWPEHVARISEWEASVSDASKRGGSTFMTDAHAAKDRRAIFNDLNIHARVEWSRTTRGGRQYDLLADALAPTGCSSSYGLCDQGAFA